VVNAFFAETSLKDAAKSEMRAETWSAGYLQMAKTMVCEGLFLSEGVAFQQNQNL
jgi:hypothetical protein